MDFSYSPISMEQGIPDIQKQGWLKVRHVPAGLKWHPATDALAGTAAYGKSDNQRKPWSVRFDNLVFDQFLFALGNLKKWMIISASEIQSPDFYENDQYDPHEYHEILRSSESEQPTMVKLNKQKGQKSNPKLIFTEEIQDDNWNLLYAGDNSKSGAGILLDNFGADVYVRQSQKMNFTATQSEIDLVDAT